MLSLSADMGFSQCLDNFLLLGRDRKLSESRGISIDVPDVGNRKLSYVTCQPSVTCGYESFSLISHFVAVTESSYSRAAEDQVIFIHLSRIFVIALDLI